MPVDVSPLELQEKATAYDNCRVRGEYPLWQHGIGITDPKTGKTLVSIILEFKDEPDVAKECRPFQAEKFFKLVQSGELQQALKNLTWIVPLAVKPLPENKLKTVVGFWKRKHHETAEIIVVGR